MSGRAFHFTLPVGFESLVPVADLTDRVGAAAPLYAIRLWQHRFRSGERIEGENAAGVVERLAGWTRGRGKLADALLASGIVEQTPKGIRIRDPFDLGAVEWMGGRFNDIGVEPEVSGLAPDDRKRRYEAERRRIKRDKSLPDDERAAALSDLRRTYGVGRPDKTGHEPDMSTGQNRTSTGQQADTNRTRTGHEPDTQDKERAHTPATGTLTDPDTSDPLARVDADTREGGRKGQPDSTAKAGPVEQAVTEVLEHWRDVVWVPSDGSPDAPIDEKRAKNRRKVVRGLLGDGWTVERLKAVCDGVSRDDWLMGRDPKAKAGGWTEVENVFRRSKLEAREKAAAAPRAGPTRLSAQVYEDHNVEDLFREVSP